MPYNINLSNGNALITIPDNSLIGPSETNPSNCSLNLVGRGSVSYGQVTANNFVWMLENFAKATAPVSPLVGQLWYNNTANASTLSIFNSNSQWERVATANTALIQTQTITVSGAGNAFRLYDSTQSVDQKYVEMEQDSGVFRLRLLNDALSANSAFLTVSRIGYTPNAVTVIGSSITLNGAVSMPVGATTITQPASDNTTNVATTAFVHTSANAILSSLASVSTLANTVTGYLPLAGGTMTGTIVGTVISAYTQPFGDNSSNVATTAFVANTTRTVLTANTTLYVATSGSDMTGTGAVGSPFATLQQAYNTFATQYDCAGYSATVAVAAGTYTAGVVASLKVNGPVNFIGNDSPPTGWTTGNTVLISVTNNHAFSIVGYNVGITVAGFKVETTGTIPQGYGLVASGGAVIARNMNFGTCANAHIVCQFGSLNITGTYVISGSAPEHLLGSEGGVLNAVGCNVYFTNTPVFTNAYAFAYFGGLVQPYGSTWSGTASGQYRYYTQYGGVVNTNGGGFDFIGGVGYTPTVSNGTNSAPSSYTAASGSIAGAYN